MKIIIDERERDIYEQCNSILSSSSTYSYLQVSREVLELGDIIFKTDDGKDVLIIERKSFSDLMASIKDGRYEEQSYRLLNSTGYPPHSIIYLLEGVLSELRTPIEKKILYSAMTSLNYFKGFSVHRTSSKRESAEWILHMGSKIEKEFIKGKVPYYLTQPFMRTFERKSEEEENMQNVLLKEEPTSSGYCSVVKKVKKENITPENIGEIILCQLPGISSTTAIAVMKRFQNFTHLIQEMNSNPECLNNITYESKGKMRKINKTSIENIMKYLKQTIESSD